MTSYIRVCPFLKAALIIKKGANYADEIETPACLRSCVWLDLDRDRCALTPAVKHIVNCLVDIGQMPEKYRDIMTNKREEGRKP